jgi:hypothetical protein
MARQAKGRAEDGVPSRGMTAQEAVGKTQKRRSSFRASDLKRAIKALQAVGINPGRVEIERDGKIVISKGTATDVSDDPLNRWMARRAGSA